MIYFMHISVEIFKKVLILNNRPQDALFDHFWMTTTLLTIDNVIFCGFGFYPFPFATNNSKANACVRCRMLCMSSLLHSSFSLLINSLNEWFWFCLNFCGLIGFDGLKKANTHTLYTQLSSCVQKPCLIVVVLLRLSSWNDGIDQNEKWRTLRIVCLCLCIS